MKCEICKDDLQPVLESPVSTAYWCPRCGTSVIVRLGMVPRYNIPILAQTIAEILDPKSTGARRR